MAPVRIVPIVVLLAVTLSACVAGTQSGRDFIQFPLKTSEWKRINAQHSGEMGVGEFVPNEQNPFSWTKLIAYTYVRFSRINAAERRDKFKALKDFYEKRCPGLVTFNLISEDKNGVIYDRFSKPCRGHPTEHTIGRVFDGKFDRWKIYYSERTARIPDGERQMWIAWLKRAKLVTSE